MSHGGRGLGCREGSQTTSQEHVELTAALRHSAEPAQRRQNSQRHFSKR